MLINNRLRPETCFRVSVFLTLIALACGMVWQETSSQTKVPETIILAKESRLGQVTFNHLKHATENRSADLSKPNACVDCHHTAQPASEAAKRPPHKTAWPADRSTTLTMDLLEKDAKPLEHLHRLVTDSENPSCAGHPDGRLWG